VYRASSKQPKILQTESDIVMAKGKDKYYITFSSLATSSRVWEFAIAACTRKNFLD
jgi:hypothetical protein